MTQPPPPSAPLLPLRFSVLRALCLLCALSTLARADGPPIPPAILDKAKGYLAKMDLDHDGRASLLEYATAKLREANGGNGGPYKLTPKSDNYWRTLDSNKDGLVTPEEYARGPIGDELRAIDTNKDGFLDLNELAAAMMKNERAQRGDKAPSFIERYDLDKDGKVTRAEWPGSDAVFDRLDTNRDGVIDSKDAPR